MKGRYEKMLDDNSTHKFFLSNLVNPSCFQRKQSKCAKKDEPMDESKSIGYRIKDSFQWFQWAFLSFQLMPILSPFFVQSNMPRILFWVMSIEWHLTGWAHTQANSMKHTCIITTFPTLYPLWILITPSHMTKTFIFLLSQLIYKVYIKYLRYNTNISITVVSPISPYQDMLTL